MQTRRALGYVAAVSRDEGLAAMAEPPVANHVALPAPIADAVGPASHCVVAAGLRPGLHRGRPGWLAPGLLGAGALARSQESARTARPEGKIAAILSL